MTYEEAQAVADRIEHAGAAIMKSWIAETGHPEVGFIILSSACMQMLEAMTDEQRERFGRALIEDVREALGEDVRPASELLQ